VSRRDAEDDADPAAAEPEAGYLWTDAEQADRLPPEDYRLHAALLEEIEAEELEAIDLGGANDYILWAAAQAFDEIDRPERAIDLLRRVTASTGRHPALDYPAIRLRLADQLKDRGEYDAALLEVERAAGEDGGLADACRERRAEILVLMGRRAEGIRLFEMAARLAPGDPWVPLQAAWAFLQRGEYDDARDWTRRADQARRDVEDEETARDAAAEIDRLREEIEDRARRRAATAGAGLAAERDRILSDLDREESLLVQSPPRAAPGLETARLRLTDLHARASAAWDDAVEAGDEPLIAAFDDLRWEIVGLAQRFGVSIPGTDE
jgi:tetratricopeptide (TPR) repeat protein